jgi:hypothetical protein
MPDLRDIHGWKQLLGDFHFAFLQGYRYKRVALPFFNIGRITQRIPVITVLFMA